MLKFAPSPENWCTGRQLFFSVVPLEKLENNLPTGAFYLFWTSSSILSNPIWTNSQACHWQNMIIPSVHGKWWGLQSLCKATSCCRCNKKRGWHHWHANCNVYPTFLLLHGHRNTYQEKQHKYIHTIQCKNVWQICMYLRRGPGMAFVCFLSLSVRNRSCQRVLTHARVPRYLSCYLYFH